MTENETTMLADRLHRLADDITPAMDVVGQVRAARQRHRRQRRTRATVLAVATAATALVAGAAVTVDVLSADHGTEVAGPSTPSATAPGPTAPSTSGLPRGWEPREFRGIVFAVPPGARAADTVTDLPVSSWTDGPSLIWNGPQLGGDAYSSVNVTITQPFEGGLPPREGGTWFTVPGAEKAYGNIEQAPATRGGRQADRTIVWLEMLDGDRIVNLEAAFAAGPEGEQMARDLVASISVG